MKVVRLYSQTLTDVAMGAASDGAFESVLKQLKEFSNLLIEIPKLNQVFESPIITAIEKQNVLNEIFKKESFLPLTSRFLTILARRNRLSLLGEILKEVEVMQLEKSGGILGELVSATPLAAGVSTTVAQALSKKLNKPVQLKEKVDPSLIAGMRVTIGGITYDGSVRNKLDKLVGSFR